MELIPIYETDEYERLVELMIRHGLEFSLDEPEPTDLVKLWKAETDEKLIGGCVLAKRGGAFVLDGIAVEPEYRHQKIASRFMQLAILEMLERGGRTLYLVARAPGFFRTLGFQTVDPEEAPNLFGCPSCPQYGKTCHPEVMVLDLGAGNHGMN